MQNDPDGLRPTTPSSAPIEAPEAGLARPEQPREIGGPPGPEPTRYGDWEKGGRCIDF